MRLPFLALALALVLAAAIGLGPAPGRAATFETCTKDERAEIDAAMAGDELLARSDAAAVADDATFVRWFGAYSPKSAETVRRTLQAVHDALAGGVVNLRCIREGSDGCERGIYAYVHQVEPYHVHLCPSFRRLPAMFDIDAADPGMENGTREGTIIHEVSHFDIVAGTQDSCYARSACAAMARQDPASVLRNADSYQYYAEDVGLLQGTGTGRH